MECLDVTLALHALIGTSLTVAGAHLMMNGGRVERGDGAYCFAFGFFIIGLASAGRDVSNLDVQSRRAMLGAGSAVAVVAGTFMMHYHVQERVRQVLKDRMDGNPVVREDIVKSIPIIDHVLVYAGYAGLVMTIALQEDNSVNLDKGGLAASAVLVICYAKNKLAEAMVSGQDVQKHQLAYLLSHGLLVLAISYSC